MRRPFGHPRRAHALRSGDGNFTYLAYGMRREEDIIFYPRSRKAYLGSVLVRLELADDYWDGERY